MAHTENQVIGNSVLKMGAIAGIAGGLAEVVWIWVAQGLTGGSAANVAAEVTETVAPTWGAWNGAVVAGLAVHMVLAIGLGLLVAATLRRVAPAMAGTLKEAAIVVLILAGVWTMNFLVVLPIMNPDFVHIVPMPVSFVSKMLFGLAAAFVFMRSPGQAKRDA